MTFLKNVLDEMKQVTWPKRNVLAKSTATVVFNIVFFAIVFGFIDLGLTAAVRYLLSL